MIALLDNEVKMDLWKHFLQMNFSDEELNTSQEIWKEALKYRQENLSDDVLIDFVQEAVPELSSISSGILTHIRSVLLFNFFNQISRAEEDTEKTPFIAEDLARIIYYLFDKIKKQDQTIQNLLFVHNEENKNEN